MGHGACADRVLGCEGRLLLTSQTGAHITYREDIPISLSRDRWKWSLGQFHMAELQTQDNLLLREQASKVWARGMRGRGHMIWLISLLWVPTMCQV